MFRSFLIQLGFLTIIPPVIKVKYDDNSFAKGIIFAPVVGFIIGITVYFIQLPLTLLNSRIISAAVIVLLYAFISGGLHLDGLADTFDGLLSGRSKERILQIMKEPSLGTFGMLALIFTLLLKFAFLTAIDFKYFDRILISMPVMSRLSIIIISALSGYTGIQGSPASIAVNYIGKRHMFISTAFTLILTVYFLQFFFFAYLAVQFIFIILFAGFAGKKIGGITGDIIGAAVEITEIIFLFISVILTNYAGGLWVKFI